VENATCHGTFCILYAKICLLLYRCTSFELLRLCHTITQHLEIVEKQYYPLEGTSESPVPSSQIRLGILTHLRDKVSGSVGERGNKLNFNLGLCMK
jgi:hypothetical protein